MRRLIINADDFGLTAGVNRAIAEAHSRGVLTSATLMARSSAFLEAAQIASSSKGLGVGCHIVLVDGSPVLPPHLVPSLLHNGTQFRKSLGQLAFAIARGRINASEVEAEATAQIAQLQSGGVRVSHIDTHKHVHMFPSILKPLLRAARTCGVHAVRNPFTPARCIRWKQLVSHPNLWKRFFAVQVLRGFAPDFLRIIERDGIITTDGCLGVIETGALSMELLREIVDCMPEGTWELVCHPGYNDADLSSVQTRLRESRAQEMELLTAPFSRTLLSKQGVELINFWDIQQQHLARPTSNPTRTAV